jgi:hypothetical protein
MGDNIWITGALLTDCTSNFPEVVNVSLEKEQMTEHTAAFKIEVTLETMEDTVSHDIIEMSAESAVLAIDTRNGYMRQNSTTKGGEATDDGISRRKSFRK